MAGLDVHKKVLAIVIRQERDGQVACEKRKFGTTRAEMEHAAAWPRHKQVSDVVMELTARSILAAGVVWAGVAFPAAPDSSVEDPRPAGTETGFSERTG